MARKLDDDTVMQIIRFMSESNANQTLGLSIPQLVEVTGLSYKRIRNIVNKEELGFSQSIRRSTNGAVTYYHSVANMAIAGTVGTTLDPLRFDDETKLEMLVENLMKALYLVDPRNQLTKAAAETIIAEKTAPTKKGAAARNYFDWMLSEADIDYLAGKAKEDKSWRGKELIAKIEAGVGERLKEYGTPIEANRMMLHDLTNSLRKWTLNDPDADAVKDSEGAIRNALGILYMALKYNRLVS